jgi:hypothetical protein
MAHSSFGTENPPLPGLFLWVPSGSGMGSLGALKRLLSRQ